SLESAENRLKSVLAEFERQDSIFYNFQKGSFSAICLLKNGSYQTFFGNYSLKGDKISIILLPQTKAIINEIESNYALPAWVGEYSECPGPSREALLL
ncbi:hypothetical protein PZH42_30585, partial [Bacteroides cellulosilyticus]|nr:hypothetical protein [Bacteroides cellulosilyticus]